MYLKVFDKQPPGNEPSRQHRLWGYLILCLSLGFFLSACNTSSAAAPDANASTLGRTEIVSQEAAPAAENSPTGLDSIPGSEEFGLTKEGLVKSIEAVEANIAECMNAAGFEYIPVDYLTVRKAMVSDKSAPGMGDEEYAATFGYGISTQLRPAGTPPQHAGPDSVIQLGLGEQNIQIFDSLSEADQIAYNHTLFGENTDATFALKLEQEDFSETGGCTRTAIEQVFEPEQLSASYYNPGDALIEQDPRMIEALAQWSACMREAGFNYNTPEETEPDFKERLDVILDGADPSNLSSEAQAALTELQGEERAVAVADLTCEDRHISRVESQIEIELYSSDQN
ncbi:MAG: hypothetical protein R3264_08805 [Anaerolineae bacterium]|nr:hypothetical protein [Anaerolineae bacterium]